MAQAEKRKKFLEVKLAGPEVLVFELANGQNVRVNAGHLNETIRHQAMMHGLNQKIRDSAANCSKTNDFAQALQNMGEVVESLLAGTWNRQGGGGQAGIVQEDLAAAIAQFKGADEAKCLAAVRAATPEKRAEWAKNPRIAAFMADAKAKRLAAAAATASDELDIDLGEDDETDGEDEAE